MPFRNDKLIRFHHCDPAGIVFYPRYFVLFHELYEDWFAEGLGGQLFGARLEPWHGDANGQAGVRVPIFKWSRRHAEPGAFGEETRQRLGHVQCTWH